MVGGGKFDWRGMHLLNAADCAFSSSPLMSRQKCQRAQRVKSEQQEGRFIQRCISIITMATIFCLVARRAKSVVWHYSATALVDISQQVSLIYLQNSHCVQGTTSLTHCLIHLGHHPLGGLLLVTVDGKTGASMRMPPSARDG